MAFAGTAVVFVEGDVENPVAAILDAPVAADQVSELFRLGRVAGEVERFSMLVWPLISRVLVISTRLRRPSQCLRSAGSNQSR